MISPYIIHLLILVGIYIVLSVSLNLVLGYTGLLNLGHIALFGIGAYTSTLLAMNGVPFVIAFLCGGLLAALFGFILVAATRRLQGDYYALATLGFAFVIYSLFINLIDLTRGPLGIPGIPKPEIFGMAIQNNLGYLIFVACIAVIVVSCVYAIVKSPFGRLLEAMRDDEIGLRVLGRNTTVLKYKAMMISAFFAGLAGSLFAHYISFIDPSTFYIEELILVITMVVVGGIASMKGSIVAPFIFVLLPEALRFLPLPSSIIGPGRQIIYALILLLILLYRPRGLFGRIDLE